MSWDIIKEKTCIRVMGHIRSWHSTPLTWNWRHHSEWRPEHWTRQPSSLWSLPDEESEWRFFITHLTRRMTEDFFSLTWRGEWVTIFNHSPDKESEWRFSITHLTRRLSDDFQSLTWQGEWLAIFFHSPDEESEWRFLYAHLTRRMSGYFQSLIW